MPQLHKVGRDFVDGLPWFIVDTIVPAQVAGIVIGHQLIRADAKVKILQELGKVKDFHPAFLEFSVLGFVGEGPGTVRTARNDCPGTGGQNPFHIGPGKILIQVVPHVFQNPAAAHLVDQRIIHFQPIQEFQGRFGGLILPVKPHASHKKNVFRFSVVLPVEILRFVFRIDIRVVFQDLVHTFEGRMT